MVLAGVCKDAERAENSQEAPGLPWALCKKQGTFTSSGSPCCLLRLRNPELDASFAIRKI